MKRGYMENLMRQVVILTLLLTLQGCDFGNVERSFTTDVSRQRIERVMFTERQMTDAIDLLKAQERANLEKLPQTKNAWSVVNRYINKKYAVYERAMNSADVQEKMIDAYIETFSKDELDTLLDFFETKAGKHYLMSTHDLSQVPMQTINNELMKRMPEIIQITQEFQRDLELYNLQ